MPTAFIFHGTNGHPEENWFPWAKKELEKLGCKVIVPQFPTPENQTPETWFKVFDKYKNEIDSNTILIGHSLGGTFALRVLEKLEKPIKAAYFVAAPIGIMPIRNYATDKPFLETPFNWIKIKKNCKKFVVFHSDDDPFVCIQNAESLVKNLNAKFIHERTAGHFNAGAGYVKFEGLLNFIAYGFLPERSG